MDIFLIILGAISLLVGLLGCVLPVLPGVPLAYLGLWLLHWTDKVQFSWQFLVIWGIVTVVVQVLDFVIPIWGTKKFGGSKWGTWGSTIGLVVGMLMGPLGIILGPFVGAVFGELLYFNRYPNAVVKENDSQLNQAIRAGIGSFIGFLTGSFLKILCCSLMIFYFVKELI